MIEKFEVIIHLLGIIDWGVIFTMVLCVCAFLGVIVGVVGIYFAYSQIKATRQNKQVELCTHFYDKFEDMNKDETIVKFREYLFEFSFVDKCKDECVYGGNGSG